MEPTADAVNLPYIQGLQHITKTHTCKHAGECAYYFIVKFCAKETESVFSYQCRTAIYF